MGKDMHTLGMAAAITIVVILAGALLVVGILPFFGINLLATTPSPETPGPSGTTPSGAYYGFVKLYTPYMIFNGTGVAAAAGNPNMYLFHADKLTQIGTGDTGANGYIQGNLNPADNGICYLVADTAGTTTYYVDPSLNIGGPVLGSAFGWDWDHDGFIETAWQLDLGHPAIVQDVATESVAIQGFVYDSGPTITGLVNSTTTLASTYQTRTSTDYISGWTGSGFGYGFKATRLQITFPDTANATYYEDGYMKAVSITVNWGNGRTQSYSNPTWDYSSKVLEFNIGVTNTQSEFYGKPVIYGQGDGTTSLTLTVNCDIKYSTSTDVIVPSIKIYYADPTDTVTSTTFGIQFGTDGN